MIRAEAASTWHMRDMAEATIGRSTVWRRFVVRGCIAAATLASHGSLATGAAAQWYDPSSGASPLTLLQGPADPLAYYRMRERVRSMLGVDWVSYLVRDGNVTADVAASAEPLAERLVRDYPRDRENWVLLATAKRLLGKHAEAAAAYERVGAISGWEISAALNAAASHLAAGDKRAAMDLIRRQIVERATPDRATYFSDDRFAALRDDPEFRALVGQPDGGVRTRDQGWLNDIDFLLAEIRRANSEYRDRPLPPELLARSDALKRNIASLSDEQILVEMNRMLATLRQGHTTLRTFERGGPIERRRLPLRLYTFADGIFVTHAAPAYQRLVGSRVVAIGGKPAEDVLRRVAELLSVDGDMEYLLVGTNLVGLMPVLKGLGVADAGDAVDVTVQGATGTPETLRLAATQEVGWMTMPPPGKSVAALSRGRDLEAHAETKVPEHDALYVQFNQVADDRDETLRAFGIRLNAALQKARPGNLVLDIRANGGGDTARYQELLRTLIAYSVQPGAQIYVLMSRGTYSAASNFITELERLGHPIFIGEPPSECCNLNGDPSTFVLPFSRIRGTISAVKWNLSHPFDTRREISPDVPVQITAKDYFAGRDTVLETAYRLIDERRRTSSPALRPSAAQD